MNIADLEACLLDFGSCLSAFETRLEDAETYLEEISTRYEALKSQLLLGRDSLQAEQVRLSQLCNGRSSD